MFRNRILILLGGCFLAASAALADDVGFVDCSKNADGAQVFARPRRSPDVVASVPCGERFTILVYGFVFSRIQTSDGKVGFVYSSVIAVDRSGASVPQTSPRVVTASDKVAVRTAPAPAAQPAPPASAQPQPALQAPPAPAEAAQAQMAPSPASVAAPPPATAPSALAAKSAEISVPVAQPAPPAPAPPQPMAAQPAPAPAYEPAPSSVASAPASPASTASASTTNVPEPAAPVAQPDPTASAQPEPAPAQPAAPAVRPVETTSTWEKRNPGGVRRTPLIEVFGGYAFARLDGGGGAWTNINGGMGSFGWNFKPWLQLVADSSYSTVTISGTKNVLYGNHFGPRYFYRNRNRWGITPFVEGLVGGSRADTTVTGVGGYKTSANCISYKVGGGVDLHPSHRWEIRLFDVDYYRTSFGTGVHQNNYWASAGIVIHFLGGSSDY